MTLPTPCTRHSRTVWMAGCPVCTAWHLPAQIAARVAPRGRPTQAVPEPGIAVPGALAERTAA